MLRTVLACFVFAPAVIACAPQTDVSTEAPQEVRADDICEKVMGLWTGEVYFPRCQESVAGILAAGARRQTVIYAYKECASGGLEDDDAALSSCMQDSISKGAAPQPPLIAYPGSPDTEPGKRFDDVSFVVQKHRERYVCAQLGMLPGSGPFDDCVGSLEDALIPNKY